jgi:BirA family transcriptional regulator, biotin operon repressor / biotin---[acetyl-CoA-carboxylase] ligase
LGNHIRDELISILIQTQPSFLSGEEISRKVGCSRMAIWKHITELRQAGYEIEARPRRGYRLVYRPDRVAPEELLPHLQTRSFGREIHYEYATLSTQILAHQWARVGAPEGAVVIAEEQTQGRGRLGRNWHSPPQTGIWISLILRPILSPMEASQMTLLAAVGVLQGIERITGLSPQIKWPNDLLIQGKKVCGILTELRGEQDQIHYIVVGIGINVNTTMAHFPPELRRTATSLAIELGGSVHRPPLLAAILAELEKRYEDYLLNGFLAIQAEWEQRADIVGKVITARGAQGAITGTAERLNENGALLLRTTQGVVPIYSADIDME